EVGAELGEGVALPAVTPVVVVPVALVGLGLVRVALEEDVEPLADPLEELVRVAAHGPGRGALREVGHGAEDRRLGRLVIEPPEGRCALASLLAGLPRHGLELARDLVHAGELPDERASPGERPLGDLLLDLLPREPAAA